MEILGIALSVPAAFIASAVYYFIVRWVIFRWPLISTAFYWSSILVLAVLFAEFVSVVIVSPLTLDAAIGQAYYPIHIILFFLAIPSLVNVLQIQKRVPFFSRWYVISFLCILLDLAIVLLQYYVSEVLYGVSCRFDNY